MSIQVPTPLEDGWCYCVCTDDGVDTRCALQSLIIDGALVYRWLFFPDDKKAVFELYDWDGDLAYTVYTQNDGSVVERFGYECIVTVKNDNAQQLIHVVADATYTFITREDAKKIVHMHTDPFTSVYRGEIP